MKDYYDLYFKCDVLFLADVFEKFRNSSLRNYGLCSSHYLSAPALGWHARLSLTRLELATYENLIIYLRLGLKLKKINRVLEFSQSQLLKLYVEFNKKKRINAEKVTVSKVTLTIKKQAYVDMCMIDFGRVLMYEFHYNYI